MSEVKKILEQRGSRYGTIEENAYICQGLLGIVDKSEQWEHLSEVHREVIHMIFHKLSRMISGDQWYDDNSVDIEGYAHLLTEYIQEHNIQERLNESD